MTSKAIPLPDLAGFTERNGTWYAEEIPLSDLPENITLLQQFDVLVFICKSGIRSKKAVLLLQEKGYAKPCYSVQKGVEIFKK